MSQAGRLHRLIITFYQGINSVRLLSKNQSGKFKPIISNAIRSLKKAARLSRWNFGGKVHLVEAELYSLEGKNDKAEQSYEAAITSSRSSRFIVSTIFFYLLECHIRLIFLLSSFVA